MTASSFIEPEPRLLFADLPAGATDPDEAKVQILDLATTTCAAVADEIACGRDECAGEHFTYIGADPAVNRLRSGTAGDASLAGVADSPAAIERATGMLMLIFRIGAESARELLEWRSQETNVRLRPLAEQVMTDFGAMTYGTLPPPSAYRRLLLTAHLRVGGAGIDSAVTFRRPLDSP
jgi:hypothetical protein